MKKIFKCMGLFFLMLLAIVHFATLVIFGPVFLVLLYGLILGAVV